MHKSSSFYQRVFAQVEIKVEDIRITASGQRIAFFLLRFVSCWFKDQCFQRLVVVLQDPISDASKEWVCNVFKKESKRSQVIPLK